MSLTTLRSSAGFTYVGALVMAMIVGIMASRAAVIWKTSAQREKETELIFRGMQYRDALRDFYGMSLEPYGTVAAQPGTTVGANAQKPVIIPPNAPRLSELKDLVSPTTQAQKKPKLRRLYLDPMTGKEFVPIVDQTINRIVGVKSASEAEPIKKANFPYELEPSDFVDKKKYSEWEFRCNRYPKPGDSGVIKGLDTKKLSDSPIVPGPK
jgi:type II secretory pathway pseudopilin PulG